MDTDCIHKAENDTHKLALDVDEEQPKHCPVSFCETISFSFLYSVNWKRMNFWLIIKTYSQTVSLSCPGLLQLTRPTMSHVVEQTASCTVSICWMVTPFRSGIWLMTDWSQPDTFSIVHSIPLKTDKALIHPYVDLDMYTRGKPCELSGSENLIWRDWGKQCNGFPVSAPDKRFRFTFVTIFAMLHITTVMINSVAEHHCPQQRKWCSKTLKARGYDSVMASVKKLFVDPVCLRLRVNLHRPEKNQQYVPTNGLCVASICLCHGLAIVQIDNVTVGVVLAGADHVHHEFKVFHIEVFLSQLLHDFLRTARQSFKHTCGTARKEGNPLKIEIYVRPVIAIFNLKSVAEIPAGVFAFYFTLLHRHKVTVLARAISGVHVLHLFHVHAPCRLDGGLVASLQFVNQAAETTEKSTQKAISMDQSVFVTTVRWGQNAPDWNTHHGCRAVSEEKVMTFQNFS